MNPTIIIGCLNTMTRNQLRAVASSLKVSRGKKKTDTLANVMDAICTNDARLSVEFTIREKSQFGQDFTNAIFKKKLRTYREDIVIISPPKSL
jgi:hypothetical protein